MKVALVHDFLTQYGGAEKVLLALHEIWPEAPVFTLFYDKKKLGDKFSAFGGDLAEMSKIESGDSTRQARTVPLLFTLLNYEIVGRSGQEIDKLRIGAKRNSSLGSWELRIDALKKARELFLTSLLYDKQRIKNWSLRISL